MLAMVRYDECTATAQLDPRAVDALPAYRFSPTSFATYSVAGRRATAAGVPSCTMLPSSSTRSRSASTSASSGSWVTRRHGPPKSDRWRRELGLDVEARPRIERRQAARRAAAVLDLPANARASATRWA